MRPLAHNKGTLGLRTGRVACRGVHRSQGSVDGGGEVGCRKVMGKKTISFSNATRDHLGTGFHARCSPRELAARADGSAAARKHAGVQKVVSGVHLLDGGEQCRIFVLLLWICPGMGPGRA